MVIWVKKFFKKIINIRVLRNDLYADGWEMYVNNAAAVRKILEQSGKTLVVFQGHKHTGDYRRIAGIHYYTLKAAVEGSGEENNAYAIVEIDRHGQITIDGYRKANEKSLKAKGENDDQEHLASHEQQERSPDFKTWPTAQQTAFQAHQQDHQKQALAANQPGPPVVLGERDQSDIARGQRAGQATQQVA